VTLHLHGLGHFHPENEITNKFLEDLDIGTNDEWIMERVGIRVRRTTMPLDYIKQTRPRHVGQLGIRQRLALRGGLHRE